MTSKTIASLALLKARYDTDHEDIVDSFKVFVLLTIIPMTGNAVRALDIQRALLDDYGLNLPQHVIQLVLSRVVKDGVLTKNKGDYQITNRPDPETYRKFITLQEEAIKNQNDTIASLMEYAKEKLKITLSAEEAETALSNYIDQYSIECVKAYSVASIVPVAGKSIKNVNFIVSSYINDVSASDPYKFHYIVTVVIGRMVANALLGTDLYDVKMKFENTVVYLDAPLILKILGVLGEAEMMATKEMVDIIKDVGGKVSYFEHTRDEIDYILRSVEKYLDVPAGGYGNVIFNLRECGKTASDIALLRAQIEEVLAESKINITPTPPYIAKLQIDEKELESEMTNSGLFYSNDTAKRKDINSIRSIYVLRTGQSPKKIERCSAILVTNNSGLAKAATYYGRHHEESKEISTVITDFSLTNLIWLKCPVAHADVPMKLIAANSYAALKPSEKLWKAFVAEIDKLETGQKISAKQHQFLRYDLKVRNDLVNLTNGGEDSLTPDKIYKILEMHEKEIVAPYEEALVIANKEKDEVIRNFDALDTGIKSAKDKADLVSKKISLFVKGILLLLSLIFICYVNGWGFDAKAVEKLSDVTKIVFKIGAFIIGIFTVLGQVYGTSMWNPINWLANRIERLMSKILYGLFYNDQ